MNAKKNSNFREEFFLTRTKKSSINRFSLSDFVRKKKNMNFADTFQRERENKKMRGKNSEKNKHFE